MPRLNSLLRFLQGELPKRIDRLYGYDVFIAHRRADGAGYASRLVERLDREKLSSFIDTREYGAGDDLPTATQRHIQRATMLVVIGSPAIREPRHPDWVLEEIDSYLREHPGEMRRLLPIDFGGTLQTSPEECAIAQRVRNAIRIDEPLEALNAPPSEVVVKSIAEQFRKRRRDRMRLRVFQIIAATLALLAIGAGAFAWLANQELHDARRNLAGNYMTASQARLNQGYFDEAAALAAESLRNFDAPDARRLIIENPPLDLGRAINYRPDSTFAFAVHPASARFAAVGYRGLVTVDSLDPGKPLISARPVGADLWGVAFTPDGSRLLAGSDEGHLLVLDAMTLQDSGCAKLPRFDDRVDGFQFLPGKDSVLVRASKTIYLMGFKNGCPSAPAKVLYRGQEPISDFVIDARNQRLIATQSAGLVSVPFGEGDANRVELHPLPGTPGKTDRPIPIRVALQPKTDKICILSLSDDAIRFVDTGFSVTDPLELRPFGPDGPPLHVRFFGFDSAGDRLVIVAEWPYPATAATAYIWSLSERRLQRRFRLSSTVLDTAVLVNDVLVVSGRDNHAASLRTLPLDSFWRRPVELPTGAYVTSVEETPDKRAILAGSRSHGVLSVDWKSAKASSIAAPGHEIKWAGYSPNHEFVGYFGELLTIAQDGKPLRQESFSAQSGTGIYSATWLDDSSALVVGLGWTKPYLVPVDGKRPLVPGPQVLNSAVESIVPGPAGRVILRAADGTWMWDTRRNVFSRVNLVPKENTALMDIKPWTAAGVAALTRAGLFLWRWSTSGSLGLARSLSIRGDRFAVSANGKRIALLDRFSVQIYDAPDGRLRANLLLPGPGELYLAALSADGSLLMAARRDGPPVVWSLSPLDRPAREVADAVQLLTGKVNADFTLSLPPPSTNPVVIPASR